MIDISQLTPVDWIIVVVLVSSILLSLWRGFAREAVSLAGWVAAFVFANMFVAGLASVLMRWIDNITGSYIAAYALLFVEGEKAGQAYPLVETEVTLGRSRSNPVSFADPNLSRKHLAIRRVGEDFVVEDLDSAHGTQLNGKRLRGILSLAEGDVLEFGAQKVKCVRYEDIYWPYYSEVHLT